MDVFHTLAEIAVAVTGFASLVIIFRGGFSSDWDPQARLSLVFALAWSVGSLFLALLPIVAGEFGVALAQAAWIGLVTLVIYMLGVGASLTVARRRAAGRASLHVPLTAVFAVIVVIGIAAASGRMPGPMHAWYALTIVLLMLHGTAEVAVFVLQSIRSDGED